MDTFISWVNVCSMLGFFTAALFLETRSRRHRMGSGLKAPLFLALLIYGIIAGSNALEHSGVTDFFDPLEDAVEIVFTLVLLFFVYNWRKQKSHSIIQSQEIWLRSTLASIADGVITTDRDGKVLLMNPAMERLTGWSQQEAAGQGADQILRFLSKKNQQPIGYNPFHRILQGGAGLLPPQGVLLKSKDGEARPVADSASLILGPDGSTLGLVGVFKDMTEYESLTEQLAHTHKMEAIGQLSGGVAHDLNNMIGGIMGAAEVMKSRLSKEGNSRHDKLLDIVRGAAENARDLTGNLLAFSRKNKLLSTPVSPKEVVEKTLALAKRAVDKRIVFELKQDDGIHMVVGEPSQLQNALLNLILNGCDAMPKGGTITIGLAPAVLAHRFCARSVFDISPGAYVAISVADTGTGVPPELQTKIFDPFFTTKEAGKGTGLGLSAVYQTAVAHRGAIVLESAPGNGSRFTLYLPAADQDSEDRTGGNAAGAVHSGHILVIEDEDVVRSSTQMMLEDAGYTLSLARSGKEGIDLFKSHKGAIDVVVLDMVMPGMTGLEVLDMLMKIDSGARVLLTSGMNRIDRIPVTASGFVHKPFSQREIVAAIEKARQKKSGGPALF